MERRYMLQEPNVAGKYVFVPTAPSTNAWVKESLITVSCGAPERDVNSYTVSFLSFSSGWNYRLSNH